METALAERQTKPKSKGAAACQPEASFYSPELEAQDPFFNRAMQAELHRRIKNVEAGNMVYHCLLSADE